MIQIPIMKHTILLHEVWPSEGDSVSKSRLISIIIRENYRALCIIYI